MDCNESVAVLFGEVARIKKDLEKGIAEVRQVKANLKSTASDLKSQIRDSVSRHIEALRNRETWLLQQVEVVQCIKDGVLQEQIAAFNKALGRIQSVYALLEQNSELLDAETLEDLVKETLQDVSCLNLSPEETNVMSFVAHNFELQDVIHKFGALLSDSRLVEEQITFKEWIRENNGKSSQQDILGAPSSELNIHDWLNQNAVLARKAPESSLSLPQYPLEYWLSKAKPQGKQTENGSSLPSEDKEDVAVVNIEATEAQRWHKDSLMTTTPPEMSSGYFKIVRMSESSQWLRNSEGTGEPSSCATRETCTKTDSVLDLGEWLKDASTTESCKDHESHAMTSVFTGIENLKAHLASQANQQWLLPGRESISEETGAEELISSGMKSYIDSLPVESNCWLLPSSTNKDICGWLARTSYDQCKKCPVMCSKGLFKVFDEIASPQDGWLMSQELY